MRVVGVTGVQTCALPISAERREILGGAQGAVAVPARPRGSRVARRARARGGLRWEVRRVGAGRTTPDGRLALLTSGIRLVDTTCVMRLCRAYFVGICVLT